MKKAYSHSQDGFVLKLLIFITLFAEPLVSLHFLTDYTAIIDYTIILLLIIRSYGYKIPNRNIPSLAKYAIFSLFVVILKTFMFDGVSSVFGVNIGLYMKTFFSLIYLFVCYTLFEEKKLILNFSIWAKFLFWICICSIITLVLFKLGAQFLFINKEVLNYPCEQIPFIGLVHYDANAKIRPSWFFVEPSALGDVLGFNFLMIFKYYWKNHMKKKIIIYILAIFMCGSMTGVGCTLFALAIFFIISFFRVTGKSAYVLKLLMMCIIPVAITAFSTYDSEQIIEQSNAIGGSSISTRQVRLAYGLEEISNASTYQLLFGRGKDFNDFGMGVSNCYVQVLCADGVIILATFLFIVFILLLNTNYEYYYMIIAMNAIDSSFMPFFMLMMIVANQYYKYFDYRVLGKVKHINY